jgi:cell division septal protein FtsQ
VKKKGNRVYPARVERSARRRRERAHQHWASVQARDSARTLRARLGRVLALAVAVISVAAGASLGTPFGGRVAGWLAPASLSRIHVRGAFRLDPAQVSTAAGVSQGTPISRQDLPQITERVQAHPWVSKARAALLPWGVLIVEIEEQVAEAVVVLDVESGKDRVLLVNRRGMTFAPASAADVEVLPHLLPTGGVAIDTPDARLSAALDLAEQLPEHGLPGSVQILIATQDDPEGLALQLPTIPGRIVLGWVDLHARLEQLAALLASDLAEVRSASRIDLRFADQAVLRIPRSKEGEQAAATRGFAVPSTELSTG